MSCAIALLDGCGIAEDLYSLLVAVHQEGVALVILSTLEHLLPDVFSTLQLVDAIVLEEELC
jgi:hypothetical protein